MYALQARSRFQKPLSSAKDSMYAFAVMPPREKLQTRTPAMRAMYWPQDSSYTS